MIKINTYLNFNGNTEEAFNFYKSVFGGEFLVLQRFKETPEGKNLSKEDREKILHIALRIGEVNTLMGTDASESMGFKLIVGNNFSISVSVDSKEEADRLFNGLSVNGKVEVPMDNDFWGGYFGMFVDKFGIQWMISFEGKK